jgi:tRNA (guanine37-N1)-methyltransferase
MKIDILTLFPSMFEGPFDTSMLKKAKDNRLVEINVHNLRDWAIDKHKTVDDRPFGGGKGMVIRVDVVDRALREVKSQKLKVPIRKSSTSNGASKTKLTTNNSQPITILLSPQGKVFDQAKARELAKLDHIILIAGHYEGFDERIAENLVSEEISIGDYVLTGGEIPAMVIVDTIVRLIPGVLEEEATAKESFTKLTDYGPQTTALDYPSYTRPEKYLGISVPKVLLSGNHKEIEIWRKKAALEKTKKVRPELIK